MTDLAHNLLADFSHTALVNTRFEGYGPKRIVRDLLAIPAKLTFDGAQLKSIDLLQTHPHAQPIFRTGCSACKIEVKSRQNQEEK